MRTLPILFVLFLGTAQTIDAQPTGAVQARSNVQFDLMQPRLALTYLQASTDAARDSLWQAHRATLGYQRLHEREAAMNRAFSDSSFRAFLDSDTLRARTAELASALTVWEHAN